jgi:hypothetical protein
MRKRAGSEGAASGLHHGIQPKGSGVRLSLRVLGNVEDNSYCTSLKAQSRLLLQPMHVNVGPEQAVAAANARQSRPRAGCCCSQCTSL